MSECQTHSVELQLWRCRNNFTYGYMAWFVSARLLQVFISQLKSFKSDSILLPSNTGLHIRHAALTIPTQTDAPRVPLQGNSRDNSSFWSGCWSAITNLDFNNKLCPLTELRWCNTELWWCWNCREELKDPSNLQSSDHRQHCCYVLFGQVNTLYSRLNVN